MVKSSEVQFAFSVLMYINCKCLYKGFCFGIRRTFLRWLKTVFCALGFLMQSNLCKDRKIKHSTDTEIILFVLCSSI